MENIIKDEINLTLFYTTLFIFGVISFFAHLEIICIILLVISLITMIYINKIKALVAFIAFIVFITGFIYSSLRAHKSDALFYIAPKNDIIAQGQVISILESNKQDRTRFYFSVDSVKTSSSEVKNLKSKTLVTLFEPKEVYSKIQIGDTLSIKGNLRIPRAAANPAEFNYQKYLQNADTFTTIFVNKNNFKILKKPEKISWKLLQKIDNQRNSIIKKHSKVIKSPYIELLGGVVFGDDAITPTDDLKESFKISGLLHLLAASGLNVCLIYGIWAFIGKTFGLEFRLNIIIGAILVLIYTCMTGFSPSILRATLMLEFVLFGKLIDRAADSFALICLVCCLMLVYNPAWVCAIGFQLSFLVTTGLILTMPPLTEFLIENKIGRIKRYLIDSACVPFIAQVWVLPLQMYYFNTFCLYSVLANILVLPFITIVSFVGFISSILAVFPITPDFVIKLSDYCIYPFLIITVKISDFISNLPNANFITIQPSIVQVIIYFILVFIITKFTINRGNNSKLLYLMFITIAVFTMSFIKISDGNLEFTFFSVRNADSCFIKTPKNHYFIIDTGKKAFNGTYSDGNAIISKYLLSKGITKIDFVILSHLDNDHIGGTVGLLEKIKVKKVFVNEVTPRTKTAKELFNYLNQNKIPYEIVKNNSTLYEETNLKVNAYLNKSIDGENENSIINLISYKNYNALFMGDAGIQAYEILPETKINLLKLGHHGARGTINKSIINKISPDTVIISTGYNQYGHPHHGIMKLFLENNIHYLRTDEKNAVLISTDGETNTEKCYIPQKHKFSKCQIKK